MDGDCSSEGDEDKERIRDRVWSKAKEVYYRVAEKPLFFAQILTETIFTIAISVVLIQSAIFRYRHSYSHL